MEWLTTCFLGIEMLYHGPWINRLSTWVVVIKFKLSSLYVLPLDFCIDMSLGLVVMNDFVRPPLGSHADMNNMSDDWSGPIQGDSFRNMM